MTHVRGAETTGSKWKVAEFHRTLCEITFDRYSSLDMSAGKYLATWGTGVGWSAHLRKQGQRRQTDFAENVFHEFVGVYPLVHSLENEGFKGKLFAIF